MCDICVDPDDGTYLYPQYGVAPHGHFWNGQSMGAYVLPKDQWPDNFIEDAEAPGMGTWYCPKCHEDQP